VHPSTLVAVALIGVAVGFLGGLFGKGGSAIATPLLALGLRFVLRPGDPDETAAPVRHPRARIVAVAAGVGLISGLLANGGGFLLAPLFVVVLHRSMKDALGTSAMLACLLAVPGTLAHAAMGHIDWTVTLVFALASIPLANAGARLGCRMRLRPLERTYGVALVALSTTFLLLAV
jgi:uncharacterized membrane protein YfcA